MCVVFLMYASMAQPKANKDQKEAVALFYAGGLKLARNCTSSFSKAPPLPLSPSPCPDTHTSTLILPLHFPGGSLSLDLVGLLISLTCMCDCCNVCVRVVLCRVLQCATVCEPMRASVNSCMYVYMCVMMQCLHVCECSPCL